MLPSERRTTWRRRRGRDTEDGELQPSGGEGVSDIGIEGGGRGVGLQEEEGGEDREVVGAATVGVAGEGAAAAGSPSWRGGRGGSGTRRPRWPPAPSGAGARWGAKRRRRTGRQRRREVRGVRHLEEEDEDEVEGNLTRGSHM